MFYKALCLFSTCISPFPSSNSRSLIEGLSHLSSSIQDTTSSILATSQSLTTKIDELENRVDARLADSESALQYHSRQIDGFLPLIDQNFNDMRSVVDDQILEADKSNHDLAEKLSVSFHHNAKRHDAVQSILRHDNHRILAQLEKIQELLRPSDVRVYTMNDSVTA